MNRYDEIEVRFKENPGLVIKQDFEIAHHESDGIYAKEMILPAGHIVLAHSHNYSHLSILAKGQAEVTIEDKVTLYTAPTCINIPAGVRHAIEAIEDIVWYCIHNEDIALCRGDTPSPPSEQ